MDTSLLNRYLSSNSSEDFQRWKIFPNVKEIMESFSCLRAVERVIPDPENRLYLVVGDGVKPRTGLTLAYYGHWDRSSCRFISIDPELRAPWSTDSGISPPEWMQKTKNLCLRRVKAQHFSVEEDEFRFIKDRIVIVAPHSHTPLLEVLHNLKKQGAEEVRVISLPCCVADNLGAPDESWTDKDLFQHTPKATFNHYHIKP